MLRFYQLISYLNLDVVAGAVACSHFAAAVLHMEQNIVMQLCLALTVWLIYTVDRIMDVSKKGYHPNDRRHLFARRHRKKLIALCIPVFMLDAHLAFFKLPQSLIVFGLLVTSAVIAYYVLLHMLPLQNSRWFQKEPVIAGVYTTAVWGSNLWLKGSLQATEFFYYVIPFYCLALMNLVTFSFYEAESDEENEERSITTTFGPRTAIIHIVFAFALVLTLGVTLLRESPNGTNLLISGTYAVIAFILFALYYRNDYFYDKDRYRVIGDAVFVLPYVATWLM
jgi:hypothetical protein